MDLDAKKAIQGESPAPQLTKPGTPNRDGQHNGPTQRPFNFPFTPYDIQVDLMKFAHETYENGLFSLLESPTGTGKSLSLICSSLSWLRSHQKSEEDGLEARKSELTQRIEQLKLEEETSNDWLSTQSRRQEASKQLAEVQKELDRINKFKQRSLVRRHAKLHHEPLENYAHILYDSANNEKPTEHDLTKQLLPNNTLAASQDSKTSRDEDHDEHGDDLGHDAAVKSALRGEQDAEFQIKPKIFYTSRTHSQLSQFIGEVKRTKFADISIGPPIKVAPLASRAHLCVNPDVVKLIDGSAINEKCAELQRETSTKKRCPYLKSKMVVALKDEILSSVHDIEDLVGRGRDLGACPYYASRMSIPEAELVVLPYNNLLHQETRKASALDLKEAVVIVDEAHNILETICSLHSAQISGQQLIGSHTILSRYYIKFRNKMNPKNAESVKTIVQCLTALIRYLDDPNSHMKSYECPKTVEIEGPETDRNGSSSATSSDAPGRTGEPAHQETIVDVVKFISAAKLEQFNIFKIIDFFGRSQLARKLIGFFQLDPSISLKLDLDEIRESATKTSILSSRVKRRKLINTQRSNFVQDADTQTKLPCNSSTNLSFLMKRNTELQHWPATPVKATCLSSYSIYTLVEFLRALTNLAINGNVLTSYRKGDVQRSLLKFVLLNPSGQFETITKEARSIILAGGTMQPFSEFTDLLFRPLGVELSRVKTFSCGHVIPSRQLCLATLSQGPSGRPLELSFKTRSSHEVIDDIGRTVLRLATITPGGMVCFLPSYDYEQLCFNRWKHIGIISAIETKAKQVLREPRQANQLRRVLDEFTRIIEKGGRGAMLMCVVGGKMSEGINFNDDLGRCIVMIGLPYANIKSGELQQKMSHYDRTIKRSVDSCQPSPGQQYYENLCIKGINQSIGRAIRHKNDYAAIVLLDRRYASKEPIRRGLPNWMRKSLTEHACLDPMLREINTFFQQIRKDAPNR